MRGSVGVVIAAAGLLLLLTIAGSLDDGGAVLHSGAPSSDVSSSSGHETVLKRTPAGAPATDGRPAASPHRSVKSPANRDLCIWPVGDSLTRGVGSHGSYREHMLSALIGAPTLSGQRQPAKPTKAPASPSAHLLANISAVVSYGSHRFPCVVKQPHTAYRASMAMAGGGDHGQRRLAPVFDGLHDGYCSAGANVVLQRLRDGAKVRRDDLVMQRACDAATLGRGALVMAGHNDAFGCARHCKIQEGTRTPQWLKLILEEWKPSSSVSNTLSSGRVERSFVNVTTLLHAHGRDVATPAPPAWLQCASTFLDEKFGAAMVELLWYVRSELCRAVVHSQQTQGDHHTGEQTGTKPMFIVVGVNPTTGFPLFDDIIRFWIKQIVESMRSEERARAASFSDGRSGCHVSVTSVTFSTFSRGVHTFDTTHPSRFGAGVMAQHWAEGIGTVVDLR